MEFLNNNFIKIKDSALQIIEAIFITSLFTFLMLYVLNLITNNFIVSFINPNIFLWPLLISLVLLFFTKDNFKKDKKNPSILLRLGLSIAGSLIFYFMGKELGFWNLIISLTIFIIIFSSTKNHFK